MRLDRSWARWIGGRGSTALSSMARGLLQFPGVPVVPGGSSSLVGSRGSPRAKVGLVQLGACKLRLARADRHRNGLGHLLLGVDELHLVRAGGDRDVQSWRGA